MLMVFVVAPFIPVSQIELSTVFWIALSWNMIVEDYRLKMRHDRARTTPRLECKLAQFQAAPGLTMRSLLRRFTFKFAEY